MPRTKGSKNKPKTVTADFATQIAEKKSAKEALTAEIVSITANIDTLKADLKVKKAALKKVEKEVEMLDSDEVYQMTKRGLDAAQISVAKRIHLNLVMVKLLELHHLGYDLRHYHAQHHAFIKQFNLPAHFQFDVAAG